MVAGLMFGIMGAFLLESLDRGLHTGQQLEKITGLPMLGMIPLLRRNRGNPVDYVVKNRFSSYAESLRAVRIAIHLSNVDNPPKTLMVTSSKPQEGKTTFCAALGRLSALSGTRTLVLDADLRRPSLEMLFPDIEVKSRLEDVLRGETALDEAIVEDPETGLHLLMSYGKITAVAELLGSKRMYNLVEELKTRYDLVIIDTPPIVGVTDTWSLARNVDSVVFLVRWSQTPQDTVLSALRQMEVLEISVSGIILSMVDIRQQSKYAYGGYSYYYGMYRQYYQE
jgi:polysaccharide biosynthesis transport protein